MSLNTENTILGNWPGPKDSVLPEKTTYQLAIKQEGVSLHFYFEKYFSDVKASFHFFSDMESLITISHHNELDAIVIGGRGDFMSELKMVQAIKQNVFLCIIPVLLYHPDPDNSIVVAAFENGAEEFIRGDWVDRLVQVRIRKVIERNRRDLSVNPSTRLPGTSIIEREIIRQIEMKAAFAVCYADLDNFKAFNDYYGYSYGDKVVKLTARIIKDVVFDICRGGFVGHIAGDDYIFIIPSDLVDKICSSVIRVFDQLIPFSYAAEDRQRGYIESVDRKGNEEKFPLLTLSIAVIVNEDGKYEHIGQLSKMLADLKKATKMKSGSNYMVERRAVY